MKIRLVGIGIAMMVFHSNAVALVTDGLAGWWPMEEASGAVLDQSGNQINAAYNGSLYQQVGRIDCALGYDGTNDYLNLDGVVSKYSAAAGTIECWVKPNSTTGTPYIACGDTSTRTYISITGGKFTLTKGNPAVGIQLGWANTGWNHIVLTWNNGVMTGYRNGVSYGTATFSGTAPGTQLKIGSFRTGSGSQNFNGIVDEVRIYDRALTAAEVAEDYGFMQVSPSNCAIVLPNATGAQLTAAQFSAGELQHHIALITGVTVGIYINDSTVLDKYRFYVGERSAFNVPQKAQWTIQSDHANFTGDSASYDFGSKIAVFAFLEEQLGVRWIEPGDGGIMVEPASSLYFTQGTYSWQPSMELRKLRPDARPGQWAPLTEDSLAYPFSRFHRTEAEHEAYAAAVSTWQLRMRLGNYTQIQYGHAFPTWWASYGVSHPEYFALNVNGVRGPEMSDPTAVKLCVSQAATVNQVIANWQAAGTPKYLNVCENDQWYGYCRCSHCVALDHPLQGESFGHHLTDRYVYFTNQVALAAKAIRSDACAVMYAYNATLEPPRQATLEPNVAVVMVPTTVKADEIVALYSGWKAAGAQIMGLRPNLLLEYDNIVIPTGSEKQLVDAFHAAYEEGEIAVSDFDSLTGLWKPNGMAFYVLAKAMSDPSKSYDYWLDEYCSAFGNAAPDIKAYYEYWRTFWNTELFPNMETIRDLGGAARQFTRGLTFSLGQYYTGATFDAADALLQTAEGRDLTPVQSDKINEMRLANEHAKKSFLATTHSGEESYALDLMRFRLAKKNTLMEHNWIGMFWSEVNYGDFGSQEAALWSSDWTDYYDSLTYPNSLVTDGLVSWWKFEEASGTIADATSSHNNGTYNGALYQRAGIAGYGLGFDGVNDDVNCGNPSSLRLTSNFTVEAWVNCAQFGTNLGIITKQVTSVYGGWSMLRTNNNKLSLLVSDTTGFDYVNSMFKYTEPGWHHVVMVVESSGTTHFYIDGVLQIEESTHGISESGLAAVVIGRAFSTYNSRFFNGTLDDVRIYNRALSPVEVNQNYRYEP